MFISISASHFALVAFDDEEHAIDGPQTSYQMRSDSARAADDKMVSQFAHFS